MGVSKEEQDLRRGESLLTPVVAVTVKLWRGYSWHNTHLDIKA
jgi:hypothetical protein